MFHRTHWLVVLGVLSISHGCCCGAPIGKQVREEMATVRRSKIGMGGLIEMPKFTDSDAVAKLVAGSSEKRIVELVGPAWRKLPATEGELWVWDMAVYREHVSLTINVVDGVQRGLAALEWRTIPDFMLHHSRSWLKAGMEVSSVVDVLGSPTRWELTGGKCVMLWEADVQLERDGTSWLDWRYAPDVISHTLRLEIVGDHLQSVSPIVSRKLDSGPSSAAQQADAAGEPQAARG